MKTAVILIAFSVASVPAFAGHIYGSLRDQGRAISQGIDVRIECGDNSYAGKTENDGSYRVFVPVKGKCSFVVMYNGKRAAADVYSYDDPKKYDFALVLQKDGSYQLNAQ